MRCSTSEVSSDRREVLRVQRIEVLVDRSEGIERAHRIDEADAERLHIREAVADGRGGIASARPCL